MRLIENPLHDRHELQQQRVEGLVEKYHGAAAVVSKVRHDCVVVMCEGVGDVCEGCRMLIWSSQNIRFRSSSQKVTALEDIR